MWDDLMQLLFGASDRLDWFNVLYLGHICAWLAGWVCGVACALLAYQLGRRNGARQQDEYWREKVRRNYNRKTRNELAMQNLDQLIKERKARLCVH